MSDKVEQQEKASFDQAEGQPDVVTFPNEGPEDEKKAAARAARMAAMSARKALFERRPELRRLAILTSRMRVLEEAKAALGIANLSMVRHYAHKAVGSLATAGEMAIAEKAVSLAIPAGAFLMLDLVCEAFLSQMDDAELLAYNGFHATDIVEILTRAASRIMGEQEAKEWASAFETKALDIIAREVVTN